MQSLCESNTEQRREWGDRKKKFTLIYCKLRCLTASHLYWDKTVSSFIRKQPFPNQFKCTNVYLMHSSNYITFRRFSTMPFFSSPKNPVSFKKFQILFEQVNCEEPTNAPPSANLPVLTALKCVIVFQAGWWLFSQDCGVLLALQPIGLNRNTAILY